MTLTGGAPRGPSRAASDALLAGLKAGRFRPGAWGRFFMDATRRSVREAAARPRALMEATLLHAAAGVVADRRARIGVTVAWLLAVSHLGMLENRRSLGLPNVLTLVRGNLPAVTGRLGRAVVPLALATDLLDGRLARARQAVTPFGAAADFLADAVVWNSLAYRAGSPRWLRVLSTTAWSAPVLGITVWSIAGGGMRDIPRSRVLRPAALAEAVIGTRLLLELLFGPTSPLSRFRLPQSPPGSKASRAAIRPGCGRGAAPFSSTQGVGTPTEVHRGERRRLRLCCPRFAHSRARAGWPDRVLCRRRTAQPRRLSVSGSMPKAC